MRIDVYYLFFPTAGLLLLAEEYRQPYLADVKVWIDVESDRTSRSEFEQRTVKDAFWRDFMSKVRPAEEASTEERALVEKCELLAFSGCWSLTIVRGSEQLKDMIAG